MDSPETAINIWTDTESLNVTPGLVSETPESIYLQRSCETIYARLTCWGPPRHCSGNQL